MKKYVPAETVLDEYTDEVLRAETFYKGSAARVLLSIPAEYRQACEVEVTTRCYSTAPLDIGLGRPMVVFEGTGLSVNETRKRVAGEILAQVRR